MRSLAAALRDCLVAGLPPPGFLGAAGRDEVPSAAPAGPAAGCRARRVATAAGVVLGVGEWGVADSSVEPISFKASRRAACSWRTSATRSSTPSTADESRPRAHSLTAIQTFMPRLAVFASMPEAMIHLRPERESGVGHR